MRIIGKYIIAIVVLSLLCISSYSCGVSLKKVQESEDKGLYFDAANGYISLYRKAGKKDKSKKALYSNGSARNYLAMGQYDKAYNYFLKAKNLGSQDSTLYLNLGKTLQAKAEYRQAEEFYKEYIKVDSDNFYANVGIKGCQLALSDTVKDNGKGFKVEKVPFWNSSRCDFSPFVTNDGNSLYFTSNRGYVSPKDRSKITGLRDNDIYIVSRDVDGVFSQRADTVAGTINTLADEGVVSISKDGLTMYYCKTDTTGFISIYMSKRNRDNQWEEGKQLYFFADSSSMQAQPSISPSGKKLAFVSNANGSVGSTDIYMYDIGDEHPSKAYNLGLSINTKGRECYPSLVSDSLLYFASDGHPSYGGLDIFKAVLLPNGNWEVSNMGRPINSSYDDYSITFINPEIAQLGTSFRQKGYFASTRDDARGYPHIYSFVLPDIYTVVEGYVVDRERYAIEGAKVRIIGYRSGDTSIKANEVITGEDGHFQMNISGDVDYIMLASAKGYLNQYVRFRTDSLGYDATYSVDFVLSSKEKAEVLRNIYYDFDSSKLRAESKPALDSLVDIMQQNPDISIIISSYADRFGSDSYNIDLSKERANSVVAYLVSKGIDSSRLESEGYGKSVPFVVSQSISERYNFLNEGEALTDEFIQTLSEEEQEVCDQLNRRTEFRVKSDDKNNDDTP